MTKKLYIHAKRKNYILLMCSIGWVNKEKNAGVPFTPTSVLPEEVAIWLGMSRLMCTYK